MDEKLEKELYKKYPALFVQKGLVDGKNLYELGFGMWKWLVFLLDNLCSCIQAYIDANDKPQAEFVQIKEKFGQLRAYLNGGDDYIYGMVSLAESMSYATCESCGVSTDIIHTKGYIKNSM